MRGRTRGLSSYIPVAWVLLLTLSGTNIYNSFVLQSNVVDDNGLAQQQNQIDDNCLVHESKNISQGWKIAGGVLSQKRHTKCGTLRHDWVSPDSFRYVSGWAEKIHEHQSNCSVPVATHYLDNTYGLGSHLILWGQAVCNAMEQNYRIHSMVKNESWWIWNDQDYCSKTNPLDCYFPMAEQPKACNGKTSSTTTMVNDPRAHRCSLVKHNMTRRQRDEYRAGLTEYLFRNISPLVIQEAQRQVGVIFPSSIAPKNLIAVHIRWGDKFWEMDLPKIEEYIDAIHSLANTTKTSFGKNVDIYLATEDPMAYEQFMKFKPKHWNVYADISLLEINPFRPVKGNRASHATRNTKGRAGLVALGSLLVTLEAKYFVLTTKSNWSTLINHLRRTVLNHDCNDCTRVIDLRPDVW